MRNSDEKMLLSNATLFYRPPVFSTTELPPLHTGPEVANKFVCEYPELNTFSLLHIPYFLNQKTYS